MPRPPRLPRAVSVALALDAAHVPSVQRACPGASLPKERQARAASHKQRRPEVGVGPRACGRAARASVVARSIPQHGLVPGRARFQPKAILRKARTPPAELRECTDPFFFQRRTYAHARAHVKRTRGRADEVMRFPNAVCYRVPLKSSRRFSARFIARYSRGLLRGVPARPIRCASLRGCRAPPRCTSRSSPWRAATSFSTSCSCDTNPWSGRCRAPCTPWR